MLYSETKKPQEKQIKVNIFDLVAQVVVAGQELATLAAAAAADVILHFSSKLEQQQ